MSTLLSKYTQRFNTVLIRLESPLRDFLDSHFDPLGCVCKISARAKKIDSFIAKAESVNKDGTARYNDPLTEVQDQIGGLIVTRFLSDIPSVEHVVDQMFRRIERQSIEPESEYEFGYIGRHFTLFLPTDITTQFSGLELPDFFELQIKTLFQYAWSETNHAIGYKRNDKLNPEQRRLTAYVAAQAWGADRAVDELKRHFSVE